MSLRKSAASLLAVLQERWLTLEATPNVFSYKLVDVKKKFLPGRHQIYAELNPQRSNLRRKPQVIKSLQQEFNGEQFNFNKVAPVEILMTIPYKDSEVAMIINKAPLTKFHTLICPDVERNLPQRITPLILDFCVEFLMGLTDDRYRFGYNSPGAMASVNHLHMHLLYLDVQLYIDCAELKPLHEGFIFRLQESEPIDAVCFQFSENDTTIQQGNKLAKLYDFLDWLICKNYPHNLVMTKSSRDNTVRVHILARRLHHEERDVSGRNIGFCEFAGYVAAGDEMEYECMTEEAILQHIKCEGAEALSDAYEYLKNLA